MSSTHPIPVIVKDEATGLHREATEDEMRSFAKNKLRYSKWLYSNRKFIHDQLVEAGEEDKKSWALAFERYPKPQDTKPRFLYTPTD